MSGLSELFKIKKLFTMELLNAFLTLFQSGDLIYI